MKILRRRVKQKASDSTENWVANITVFPRHRSGPDAAEKPVAHHQFVSVSQLFEKRLQRRKIVAIVGISDDDVTPARLYRGVENRRSVAANGNVHDSGADARSDFP